MDKLRTPETDRLFEGILSLKTVDECYRFFEDLCTIRELQDMTQRFSVAILLKQGLSYPEILERVRVSTATITRINRCVTYGDGGYAEVISRLKN